MGSSHIWKALDRKLGILRPVDGNTMCPSPSTPTCSLMWSSWIHLKVWNNAEVVLLDHWLFLLPLHSSNMRNEREFPLSLQWWKLMIIQAQWVWNTNSCLGTFGHTLGTCAAADERSRLQFQRPYFSADVCNYSADLSNGSEGGWSHDIPQSPLFPQKPQPSSSPAPLLLWGSCNCLDI